MKVSDYIVEYLVEKNVTDVFGYPGGMVTHLMDSFSKYSSKIKAHLTYHEQGAAFAACGYAQACKNVGIAYATSGPGATNLITGICNAYFDSIPTIFITGQVNTFEQKKGMGVRQRGFQETDIVDMVKSVTKFSISIDNAENIKYYLDYAFYIAEEGRKGPVLLDIPMNIFRAEIQPSSLKGYIFGQYHKSVGVEWDKIENIILSALQGAHRPVVLVGNGVKIAGADELFNKLVDEWNIPVVSTMLAVDVVENKKLYYGFIGAYGSRTANFIVAKSDLLISFGARMDVRQVGSQRENFAPHSMIIRIDIDPEELNYKVHEEEQSICCDVKSICQKILIDHIKCEKEYSEWLNVCNKISKLLKNYDDKLPNQIMKKIAQKIPNDSIITTDVGQNQVWVTQSLEVPKCQMLLSGGHGAMGYSLPAAIGAYMAKKTHVFSFNGDGGIQMNIQELQVLARERLPIKTIIFNNYALGMIRHFQEMYFNKNYYQTINDHGYSVPDFRRIALAYEIRYFRIERLEDLDEIDSVVFEDDLPVIIEVVLKEETYVFPKLEFGKPNQDQEPLLCRELYRELMEL